MAAISVSIANPGQDINAQVVFATSAPGAGDIELRIKDVATGFLTRDLVMLAIERLETALLESTAFPG